LVPQPIVAVQDLDGNTVPTSTVWVSLAIMNNPSGGTLNCSSGLAKWAEAGLATYWGCSIDKVGTGYTLVATSPGLVGVTSFSFDVVHHAGTLDQYQEKQEGAAYGAFAPNSLGQTFTAGMTGTLDTVDLYLYAYDLPPVRETASLRLRTVDAGGIPTGILLATATPVTFSGYGWVTIRFPAPAEVVVDIQYALELVAPMPNWGFAPNGTPDAYPAGQPWWFIGDNPLPNLNNDFTFRTYVTPGPPADTTPPVISGLPASITAEATGPNGAVASWPDPTASDPDDAAGTPICSPTSGSTFPLGSTTVTCTSTDTHGNIGSASFTVTVVDTTAPWLPWAQWSSLDATSPAGAAVYLTGGATDLVDGPVPMTFAPPSGSTFPIGTTTVVGSAVDSHGNRLDFTFAITIKGAPEQINDLIAEIRFVNLPAGTTKALLAPLNAALRDIGHGDTASACGDLRDFINHVRAQSGKKTSAGEAAMLLADATRIRAVLGC